MIPMKRNTAEIEGGNPKRAARSAQHTVSN